MTVSLIINTYNGIDFVKKALISVSCQSVLPDEVIIADDGSEEGFIEAIKNCGKYLPVKFLFVGQKHKGFRLAKCRNNAVRFAEGEFLVFMDQDLILTKKYLETYVSNACKRKFLVSYPVRLSEEQSEHLNEDLIRNEDYKSIITNRQLGKIHKQYYKDYYYYMVRKIFGSNVRQPKLRGGAFGIFKEDLLKVDGFDENYEGWGNEDDDLGRRLYSSGIVGKNVFYYDFPLHLFHPPNHDRGKRVNEAYYKKRIEEIKAGDYRAVHGLSTENNEEIIQQVLL